MRRNVPIAMAVTACVLVPLLPAGATPHPTAARSQAARPHPGAPGAGDPYFPSQGNGGYDVSHYAIQVDYYPSTGHLTGHVRITARATTSLSRFDLDLRHFLHVHSALVDKRPASTRQPGRTVQELEVTPARPIAKGRTFHVILDYSGKPHAVHDPDNSLDGFIHTRDGAFVASEPQGSPTWFPVNDTPDDKATYNVTVGVPRRLQAISNGTLGWISQGTHRTNYSWRITRPISSYLVTATIGKFSIRKGRTPDGVPYVEAVDPHEKSAWRVLRHLPSIVDFFSRKYGRYPFGVAGAIVDHAPRVGYALETATRPLFDRAPSEATLAHELAHQWYGDTVTLHHWRDIWLNEGFAEFSSWLWTEHSGGPSAAQRLRQLMSRPASDAATWNPPPGNPGSAREIFAGSVYERGAATLQALREKIGGQTFFRIMRGWLRAHRYGNARVGEFVHYASRLADRDLRPFFRNWLYRPGKPRWHG